MQLLNADDKDMETVLNPSEPTHGRSLLEALLTIEPEQAGSQPHLPETLVRSRWEWQMAIAAMATLLEQTAQNGAQGVLPGKMNSHICQSQGLILCSPVPLFSSVAILAQFRHWFFCPIGQLTSPHQLSPAPETSAATVPATSVLDLKPANLEVAEQFCLVQTPQFSWVAVLSQRQHQGCFRFSFNPETVEYLWQNLQERAYGQQWVQHRTQIESWRTTFPVRQPHYRYPAQFSQVLLRKLSSPLNPLTAAASAASVKAPLLCDRPNSNQSHSETTPAFGIQAPVEEPATAQLQEPLSSDFDVELLKALAHEVRTPLSTIQTLTQLLLRRSDLPLEVISRLKAIRRECSGQINRFGLIFRAMELTSDGIQTLSSSLTPISLPELFDAHLERWQAYATKRSLTLSLSLPSQVPSIVISEPQIFVQILTGLIEYLSYGLSAGGHIQLKASLAGTQLKLQLKAQIASQSESSQNPAASMMKAIGHLLMFQPETGGLSLSLPASKHLFQALGGKLAVRKCSDGEILTIFLPLGAEGQAY